MNKITQITQAWLTTLIHTPEQEQIAKERLSICKECPLYESFLKESIYRCGKCKCPLSDWNQNPIGMSYAKFEYNKDGKLIDGLCHLHKWPR